MGKPRSKQSSPALAAPLSGDINSSLARSRSLSAQQSLLVKRLQEVATTSPSQDFVRLLERDFTQLQIKIAEFNSTAPLEAQIDTVEPQLVVDRLINPLFAASQPVSPQAGSASVAVPVPVFAGDLKDWLQFYGLFKALVHDSPRYTDLEKFSLLRDKLSGPALATINHYVVAAEFYQPAFKELTDWYNQPRTLVDHYASLMLDFPSKSSARDFVNTYAAASEGLDALNLPDLGDSLKFAIAYRHLPPKNRRAFEDTLSPGEVPTFRQLLTFAREHVRRDEASHSAAASSRSPPPAPPTTCRSLPPRLVSVPVTAPDRAITQSPSTSSRPQSRRQCKCCEAYDHYLAYHCPVFKPLPVRDKVAFLITKRQCLNCLGNHEREACRSKSRCRHCNAHHHSSLHAYLNEIRAAPSVPAPPSTVGASAPTS